MNLLLRLDGGLLGRFDSFVSFVCVGAEEGDAQGKLPMQIGNWAGCDVTATQRQRR